MIRSALQKHHKGLLLQLRKNHSLNDNLFKLHNLPISCNNLKQLTSKSVSVRPFSSNNNDDSEDWIPPSKQQIVTKQLEGEDEEGLEYIDLEDLMNDESLQEMLENGDFFKDISEDGFDVDDYDNIVGADEDDKSTVSDEQQFINLDDDANNKDGDDEDLPDWGSMRRRNLAQDDEEVISSGRLMTSAEASKIKKRRGEIPVVMDTLLTAQEIVSSIEELGGYDINVLPVGHRTNIADAFIISSVPNPTSMRIMADTIVRNMRRRNLHKRGVIGADKGAEGRDCSDWMIVDCDSIIVHLFEEKTRDIIGIEAMWSSNKAPSGRKKGPSIVDVNPNDDDGVDQFIAQNPVPEAYVQSLFSDAVTRKQLDKLRTTTDDGMRSRNQKMRRMRRKKIRT